MAANKGGKQQDKNIESKTLLEIDRQVNDARGVTIIIRVVDWISNGKHYPQLEKREFFIDGNGDEKMGKAKGFTMKDLGKIQDEWGPITEALGGRLPEQKQRPGGAPTSAPAAEAPVASGPTQEQDF